MSTESQILPVNLVQEVDSYVDKALEDAIKYSNSAPLDESGVYSLHLLAARIYAAGFADGQRAMHERDRAEQRRAGARERLAQGEDEAAS